MARRKKQYRPCGYESAGGRIDREGKKRTDVSAPIFESMVLSGAFQDLTDRQRMLYVICKMQRYGKRKPSFDYKDVEEYRSEACFYLNWRDVLQYGIYKETCSANFYKDMKALIDHGLIMRIASGKSAHRNTVYEYSDKWQAWGNAPEKGKEKAHQEDSPQED